MLNGLPYSTVNKSSMSMSIKIQKKYTGKYSESMEVFGFSSVNDYFDFDSYYMELDVCVCVFFVK